MSDQNSPYRPEGQPNSPGWNGPWPQQGDSAPPQPGSAAPWGPELEDAPTFLAGQQPPGGQPGTGPVPPAGGPSGGQPGGWPTSSDGGYPAGGYPAAGGYQQPGGSYPSGGGWASSPPTNSQPGWGPPPPGASVPPTWQQPPDAQQWQDPNQQWQQQPPPTASWPQQQQNQPPPGGYQPGWPPAGGPPPGGKKKTNPLFVIAPLALVAAIVLGIVIALAVRDGDKEQTTQPPGGGIEPATTTLPLETPGPTSAPPPTSAPAGQSPPGAPNCAPVAPVSAPPQDGVLDIGQTAHILSDDEYDIADFEANVTLNAVCTQTSAFDDWSEPPVQGNFVLADVTVELLAGEVSATYFDFSVQTSDGALFSGDFPPIEPRLASFDLTAGNTVRGFVLVDAPAGNHLLRWEPSYATQVGVWRY